MRIDSGLQGYYYDQGRFRRPELDKDEPVQQSAPQAVRAATSSPIVESSTLLSSSLSSALWALESGDTKTSPATPALDSRSEETTDNIRALYMQFATDFE